MKIPTILLLSLVVANATLFADPQDTTWNRLKARHDAATASLQETRSAIDLEKRALLGQLADAEKNLASVESKWELVRTRRQLLEDPLLERSEDEEVQVMKEAYSEFLQFSRSFTDSLPPAGRAGFTSSGGAEPWQVAGLSGTLPDGTASQSSGEFVESALERLELRSTQPFFPGKAVTLDGYPRDGEFLVLGPIALFRDNAQGVTGWINGMKGGLPAVAPVLPRDQASLDRLFVSRSGTVPLPLDLDNPRFQNRGLGSLWNTIGKGGIWVYPILGFAVLAAALSFLKLHQLRRFTLPSRDDWDRAWKLALEDEPSAQRQSVRFSPWARQLFSHCLELRNRESAKRESAMLKEIYSTYPEMTSGLPFITLTASVAPLLGLLGTVSGIIRTFDVISVLGTGDPQVLSGGISEALITTELGLVVAIPALVCYTLLNRKVRRIVLASEQLVHRACLALERSPEAPNPIRSCSH